MKNESTFFLLLTWFVVVVKWKQSKKWDGPATVAADAMLTVSRHRLHSHTVVVREPTILRLDCVRADALKICPSVLLVHSNASVYILNYYYYSYWTTTTATTAASAATIDIL